MTPQAGLVLSAIAFVGTHFLLSHPLRGTAGRGGSASGPFQGIYSLIALITFGCDDLFLPRDRPRAAAVGCAATLGGSSRSMLMWLGSILFVGSFVGNPALPGRAGSTRRQPTGVFAITRHPMMWGFACWAIVHLIVIATPKALVFDGAILLLALGGRSARTARRPADGRALARMDGADRVHPVHPRARKSRHASR